MFVSPIIENDRVDQHFVFFLDITDRVAREEERRLRRHWIDAYRGDAWFTGQPAAKTRVSTFAALQPVIF